MPHHLDPDPDLVPSAYHRRIARGTRQKLAFDGRRDVGAWQRRLRRRVHQALGDVFPARRVALRPRTVWKRQHPSGLGTVEKFRFTAEPGADVVAYLCLPKNRTGPHPCCICLQGHTTGMHNSIAVDRRDETRSIKVPGDRAFALGCLKRGVAALCIEQRSFGERGEKLQKQVSPHPCHDAVMHALLLGRTLAGERVFDVDRGIDYLVQHRRHEIDPQRIGVMGNSGGGTVTMFAAAVLPRLAFAMPSCAICTFLDSILSIYHCGDNYLPGIYRWGDMADILGCFAPRPLVVIAGRSDPIFPLSGTRKTFRQVQRIYKAAGAGDSCELVIGPGGHRFYERQAWAALARLVDWPIPTAA